jgi:hypothetical protein
MPSLSLNIGLNNGRKLPFGFDSDAAAYFVTAGVTDATAKSQINDFVKGVKSLGLYNNMVCWPLRSSQNAGTGTTAYSLGGLGTYNGTLTGSSSWSESGAVIPANSGITATIPYGPTSGSIIGVIQANSINGSLAEFIRCLKTQILEFCGLIRMQFFILITPRQIADSL